MRIAKPKGRWIKWTLGEAFFRSAHQVPQKAIAGFISTLTGAFFVTAIVGLVQIVLGFLATRIRRKKIFVKRREILGAGLFGFFAIAAFTSGTVVFQMGGDMGVFAFIVALALIPNTFSDLFIFKRRISLRRWFGVALALVSAYIILGRPSMVGIIALPPWIWVSFVAMFAVSINQVVSQFIEDMDPLVKNFWGGLVQGIGALVILFFLGGAGLFADTSQEMRQVFLMSLVIGVFVIGIWVFNLLSFKAGASLMMKNLVMRGVYLTFSTIFGVLFFSEPLTAEKIIGISLYFLVIMFIDKAVWEAVKRRFA